MAILDFNSTIRTTAGGQTTSTIVTANNIGSYAPSLSSTYYIGTTQNVFNRASAAQTLTGVSIDGNAATVTNGVYTTGTQTIGGAKTFSDGITVNTATYNTFTKPSPSTYQTVALFGSTGGGLFLTTDNPIIGVGAYYNTSWIATATSGRQIDFANGNFTFSAFSGATVGGSASWGTVAQLNSSGTFSATGDFRAPVFYDTNNTAYFCDPASTSNLNSITLNNGGSSGYLTLPGSVTVSNVSAAEMVIRGLSQLRFSNSTSWDWNAWAGLRYDNATTTIYLGGPAATGIFTQNATPPTVTVSFVGTNNVTSDSNFKGPIFYDSADTTYYLDPANSGTSLNISGKIVASGSASSTSGSTLLTGYYTNGSLTVFGTEYSSGGPFLGYAVSPSTSAAASFLSSTGIAIQRSAYIQDGGTHRWYLGASQTVTIGSAATLSESMRLTSTGLGVNSNNPDTNLQVVGHIHVGNQTTFENTGGWNKTIYLDGTIHARMRILGSAFASGKNSQTETYIWVDNSVSPYSGLTTNAGSFTINAGFITLTNSARSPIFYDSDDTNYYCDPNSVSRLSSLRIYSAFDTASSDVYANMRVMRNTATTDGMYIGYGNSGSTAALTRIFGGGATTGELSKYSTYTLEPGSFRSPIFYDSDDTNYYGDFASTSRLNILNLVSYGYINGQTLNGQSFYQWEGATYRNPADHTPQLLIRKDNTTTGINGFAPALALYNNNGADQTTVGMAFVSAEAVSPTQGNAVELAGIIAKKESSGTAGAWSQGSLNFFVKDFGTRRDVMSMSSSGAVTAFIDVRAPIFYDSGNTAFYVDPASTSNLNALTVAGGNATIYRDLIVNGGTSGNFGNRIIVQGTATTYTLQDTNLRPTIYLTGAYPVVTLNHTVTNNANHGPTIQFAFNGLTTGGSTSRQILIGASGDGNRLDFGFSGGASGTNSDYNPHNGIAGYSGITIMRLFNNGVLLGNTGAYPNQITSTSYSLDVRGTGYSDTDFRAPIFYDSNDTSYYVDAASTSILNRVNYQQLRRNFASTVYSGPPSGSNLVKTFSGVLVAGSANSSVNTYTVIETSIPQGNYQMGGFTINWFENYSSTNGKTTIEIAGYWNPTSNGGFIGFEFTSSNPNIQPTIQVGANASGNTVFILTHYSSNYPIIVARDLWFGYNSSDAEYGTGWTMTNTNSIAAYTNLVTATLRVGPTLTGTGASGTWGINITGNAATVTNGLTTTNYSGYSTFSGIVSSAVGGFQTATYAAGRNRIWSFGNSDGYGLSYFQGSGGISGSDVIGLHFGTATAVGSQFQFLGNGSLRVSGDVRAPIFYDSDNTAYYLDPNSSSNLNNVTVAGTLTLTNIAKNSTGPIVINSGQSASLGLRVYYDMNLYNTLVFTDSSWNSQGRIFGSSSVVTIQAATTTTSFVKYAGYSEEGGSFRAPIFYDSDNTSYYIDAAGTSSLNILNVASYIDVSTYIYLRNNLRMLNSAGNAWLETIVRNSGSPYFQNSIDGGTFLASDVSENNNWLFQENVRGWGIFYFNKGTQSGQTFGSYTTIGAETFIIGQGTGTTMTSTWTGYNASSKVAIMLSNYSGYIWANDTIFSATGMRAPIFYDSNDTNYYVDPASTSLLNNTRHLNIVAGSNAGMTSGGQLAVYSSGNPYISFHDGGVARTAYFQETGGRFYFGEVTYTESEGSFRAPLFYDVNNTSYYVDPASTSVLNNLTLTDGNLELYKSQTVDMSNTTTYSTSNYYPVTISVPTEGCIIQIQNNLNSNVPSWATHAGGFTLNLKWRTNGSGWGTTQVKRIIDQYYELFANQTICGGITQMTNSSIEVVWLRGGGQYFFKFSRNLSATAQSATYTINSQSVSPTSTAQNTIWNSANGSGTLYNDTTYSTSNMYTPVLYDYNNSAYYVDPASTSNLVGLTVANTITGSISGNAATVGSLSINTSGRNDVANQIVRTDSNGYIQAGWINTTSGDQGTSAIDRVYASYDGYIRYYTPANFRTVLDVPTRGGSGASGSWGISITGSSASCTGNAANVTGTVAIANGGTGATSAAAAATNLGLGTGNTPKFLNVFGEKAAVTSAATTTVNTQYNVTELTLSASVTTLTLSNIQASPIVHMWTIVTLGQGTAYSITWPAAVKWPGGTAPTLTSTLNKRDIYQFVTYDGGTTIYAIIVGQNL